MSTATRGRPHAAQVPRGSRDKTDRKPADPRSNGQDRFKSALGLWCWATAIARFNATTGEDECDEHVVKGKRYAPSPFLRQTARDRGRKQYAASTWSSVSSSPVAERSRKVSAPRPSDLYPSVSDPAGKKCVQLTGDIDTAGSGQRADTSALGERAWRALLRAECCASVRPGAALHRVGSTAHCRFGRGSVVSLVKKKNEHSMYGRQTRRKIHR